MHLIDTHVHLLHPDRFAYAWCAGVSGLQGAFRLEDYRAAVAAAPAGVRVESLIFMEADVPAAQQEAEAEFFTALAETDRGQPALTAVIAAAWPESPDFPAQLERLARNPRIRGLRRVLHTMPAELSQSALFAENLRRLPALGLTFDVCARPHLLPHVTKLAQRCPQTQFILDHCGVPDIAAQTLDPWRADIRELAALPNVACKLSGLPYCADPARPLLPQVRPFVGHCIETFGPARTLWGSDWPVCDLGHGLTEWLVATAGFLADYSADEQNLIASANARRIYRLN
jgi:predicted TIM-barrel fold metal-dependent hydrolase